MFYIIEQYIADEAAVSVQFCSGLEFDRQNKCILIIVRGVFS